jgi:hypothetical protein
VLDDCNQGAGSSGNILGGAGEVPQSELPERAAELSSQKTEGHGSLVLLAVPW